MRKVNGLILFKMFILIHFSYSQNHISPQSIDSNIYIFNRNSIIHFALSYTDLDTNYPNYNHAYEKQLLKYLEKKPYDLDSILRLYEVQEYISNEEAQKNTLLRYKTAIDKILSKHPIDMHGLLHASEYYRLKNERFIQMNYLDTALKYYSDELKVKEFYLNYCIQNQDYEQAQLISSQILELCPKHWMAIYHLVILHYYENAYYGIRNDYSLINQFINANPDDPSLTLLKTYLETLNLILQLTDFGLGEMNFKKWRLPMVLKNTTDSLYQAWLKHLPKLHNPAVGHSLLSLIKFLALDTLQAKIHFHNSMKLDAYYKPAYYNYFQFQLELENYKECIKTAYALSQIMPKENHYLMLAKAYFYAQNYYQAQNTLMSLLEKKTTEPHIYTALAQLNLKLRKMSEVEKYLNMAKQINPRDADYNFTAAMYCILIGNYKQAKEHLLTYLEFYEKDETAWFWLKSLQ